MASELPPIDSIAPGDNIDGFIIQERLHTGGTGYLFRVAVENREDPGFPMIMKVPRVGPGQPSEGIIAFEMEAMILPALSGRHFPRFVAAGDIATMPYLVMERVEGRSLNELLGHGALLPAEVAKIGATLADAVHALHQQQVIHHDIKPDNVILRPDGEAVLIDFGFARHAQYPDLLAEEMRYAAGSVPYVSPEQVSGSRDDARSDIFALGVLLYELATGELPFGIPATQAGMKDRLWRVPIPPRAHVATTPPWLQEVILRCIEPAAEARYQRAAHIAFDLRHPGQVMLTPRAERRHSAGFFAQLSLWWRSRGEQLPLRTRAPELLAAAPVIMVAVDTSHPDDQRHPALQWTTRQMASLNIEFRMICVSVIRAEMMGEGSAESSASGLQLTHLVRLRHWVDPLGLPEQRISLHVLESRDPADTLLDFARRNNVDLIVLGAPAPSDAALAWWRSVASTVTANASCSVHVVRVPERPRSQWHEWATDNTD